MGKLEHYGFLEFLNLKYENDSIQAQKKEVFDKFAEMARREKGKLF